MTQRSEEKKINKKSARDYCFFFSARDTFRHARARQSRRNFAGRIVVCRKLYT